MPKTPTMEEMLKAGVHFGHRAGTWHPKMKPFIYTVRNGVHIIDTKKTASKLEEAADFVTKTVAEGGDILFVATKDQAQSLIKEAASSVEMPYVNHRWLGGTITNFSEIKKSVKHYVDLKNGKESGDWNKYTKKEQIELQKDLDKLEITVSGLVNLKKLPKAVFVIDIRNEKTAVAESNVKGIPIVAVCDTNVNPDKVQYDIPGNDDATRAIEMYINYITEAVQEGLKQRKTMVGEVKKAAPKKKAEPKAESKKEETK